MWGGGRGLKRRPRNLRAIDRHPPPTHARRPRPDAPIFVLPFFLPHTFQLLEYFCSLFGCVGNRASALCACFSGGASVFQVLGPARCPRFPHLSPCALPPTPPLFSLVRCLHTSVFLLFLLGRATHNNGRLCSRAAVRRRFRFAFCLRRAALLKKITFSPRAFFY